MFKSSKSTWIITAALFLITLALVGWLSLRRSSIDRLKSEVFEGMSSNQVRAIAGEPLDVVSITTSKGEDFVAWTYAQSGEAVSVQFLNDRVVTAFSEKGEGEREWIVR